MPASETTLAKAIARLFNKLRFRRRTGDEMRDGAALTPEVWQPKHLEELKLRWLSEDQHLDFSPLAHGPLIDIPARRPRALDFDFQPLGRGLPALLETEREIARRGTQALSDAVLVQIQADLAKVRAEELEATAAATTAAIEMAAAALEAALLGVESVKAEVEGEPPAATPAGAPVVAGNEPNIAAAAEETPSATSIQRAQQPDEFLPRINVQAASPSAIHTASRRLRDRFVRGVRSLKGRSSQSAKPTPATINEADVAAVTAAASALSEKKAEGMDNKAAAAEYGVVEISVEASAAVLEQKNKFGAATAAKGEKELAVGNEKDSATEVGTAANDADGDERGETAELANQTPAEAGAEAAETDRAEVARGPGETTDGATVRGRSFITQRIRLAIATKIWGAGKKAVKSACFAA